MSIQVKRGLLKMSRKLLCRPKKRRWSATKKLETLRNICNENVLENHIWKRTTDIMDGKIYILWIMEEDNNGFGAWKAILKMRNDLAQQI